MDWEHYCFIYLKKYFFVLCPNSHLSLSSCKCLWWNLASQMGTELVTWKFWLRPWESGNSECLFSTWAEIWAIQRFRTRQLCAYFPHCRARSELPDRRLIIKAKGHCSLSKSCRERWTKMCEVSILFPSAPSPTHASPSMASLRDTDRDLDSSLFPPSPPNTAASRQPKCLAGRSLLSYFGKI